MLNELMAIERSLAARGFGGYRHPDVMHMAQGRALRVRLNEDGGVAGVEIVAEAGRGAVWTLRDGKHNGFPGLKTPGGLLLMDEEAAARHEATWAAGQSPESRRAELQRLLADLPFNVDQSTSWPSERHRTRIAERSHALATLRDDPETAAVPAVFERFGRALDASPSFLLGLTTKLGERLSMSGDEWLEPIREALVGQVDLVIDIAVSDMGFIRDAGHAGQINPLSQALSQASRLVDAHRAKHERCALGGDSTGLLEGNFPEPNLPGVGPTYLFARNKDIPSMKRYGRAGSDSFAVDADLVGRLSGAVAWLTRDQLRGKTWLPIPAETGGDSDLLIACRASSPEANLADELAGDETDREETGGESDVTESPRRVIDQSRGVYEHEYAEDDVFLLVLRKVDIGNRKAVHHHRISPSAFHRAARAWRTEATRNTPEWLGFRAPEVTKGGERGLAELKPPYLAPLSIIKLSRSRFVVGGRRRINVIGATAATAFGLFLREGDFKRTARRLLALLVRRHGALLSGLAEARHKGDGLAHLKAFDPKLDLRRDALRSVTWLGALLSILGRPKEDYMAGIGFRLGQLLAAVDVVHVGYCADLRGGEVPPTLLGNSVFAIAGGDPFRALAIVQRRWKPYAGWARRESDVRTKIDAFLRKDRHDRLAWDMRCGLSAARRVGPLTAELHDALAARDDLDKPDERFKAELLLGYMAGLPPASKEADGATEGQADDSNEPTEGEAE